MSDWFSYIPELLAVVVLLGLSGFFSGAETALFSLSRSQVHRLAEGSLGERTAGRLLRQPQRLLSTVLVGNTTVNVLLTSLCASMVDRLVQGHQTGATVLSILVVWPLLITFGELTPKTLACSYSLVIARWVALPMAFLAWVTAPAAALLRWVAQGVMWLVGQKAAAEWDNVTREEIAAMMAVAEETGAAVPHEREMVRRILRMDQVRASDIMIPRTEVIAVRDNATLAEAFARARAARRSRLPVYHEDLDDIWGVVSTMDLPRWRHTPFMQQPLASFQERVAAARRGTAAWEPLPVYPVLLVPETASIERLLAALQENRSHLAVLVSENGGTAGILTVNDVLEELLGQITPRDGSVRAGVVRMADGWHVDGRMHLRDLAEAIGVELASEEFDTVGGFIMERLGRLPRTGDEFRFGGFCFRVLRMAGRRVGTVRLTPADTIATAAADSALDGEAG